MADTDTPTERIRPMAADGREIRPGDIIEKVDPDTIGLTKRGVVEHIFQHTDQRQRIFPPVGFACVGDVVVRHSPGTRTVSNDYESWRHVDRADQTYTQRLDGWMCTPSHLGPTEPGEDEWITSERKTEHEVHGPLSLLPVEHLTEDLWHWPTHLGDSLYILAEHMDDLTRQRDELAAALGKVREILNPAVLAAMGLAEVFETIDGEG